MHCRRVRGGVRHHGLGCGARGGRGRSARRRRRAALGAQLLARRAPVHQTRGRGRATRESRGRVRCARVGSVPGTHEFVLDGAFEQVRLVHEARDRRVFALGALAAARWLAGRQGVFTLDDMLSLPGGA
ncbi:MAG: hypothetical protein HYV19_09065 [Gemmatimonadetes bacterium]|nr:hypothetical protein [Gemmatimonadota bacterium]